MSFIKTDPSQNKAVMILIVILVGAVAVTLMRIKPANNQAAPAAALAQGTEVQKTGDACAANDIIYDRLRNPFKRPAMVIAAVNASRARDDSDIPTEMLHGIPRRFWPKEMDSRLEPLEMISAPELAPEVKPSGVHITEVVPDRILRPMAIPANKPYVSAMPRQLPQFSLLATVKCGQGFSAVIKAGEKVQVVEVGDVLDGGFRVKKLGSNHAVLTDGRDTVIAKRPQS